MSSTSRQIGRYRIERELGRGAMGVVYAAYDPVVERRVALKTIDFDRTGAKELVECLKREAKAIGRLEHPNIVTLYDAGETGDTYYLVFQLIEGEPLIGRKSGRDSRTVAETVAIMLQVLAALDYSHRSGVVHRDVKPANIMVTPESDVKLMDFGIARPLGAGMTSSGLITGTPGYMSPEQVLGVAADGRSDIFSAGCLMYELLTGVSPFVGKDLPEIMHKLTHSTPAQLPGSFDATARRAVAKATAREPEDRFQSCAEFAAALRQCLSLPKSDSASRESRRALGHALQWKAVAAAAAVAIFGAHGAAHRNAGWPAIAPLPKPPSAPAMMPAVPATLSGNNAGPVIRGARPRRLPAPAIPRSEDPFTALILAGDEAFQQGRYKDALARYSEANRIRPEPELARRKLVVVLTLLGRAAEAQNYRSKRSQQQEEMR